MHKAILDFIGLPAHVPGNLECRIRRVHYRADGSVVDDGTRSGARQTNAHRFVLEPGQDIEARVAEQASGLKPYGLPDTSLMHLVARHEWREDVLYDRRAALRPNEPKLQLLVRALGFDVVGAGELAIGLGKAIVAGPGDVTITEKSSIKLLPGDPLDLVIEVLRQHASDIDFLPPIEADFSLLRHTTAALWTPERIAARESAWLDWQRTAPMTIEQGRALEFAQRIQPLGNWRAVPVGSPQPELARLN